MVGMDSSEKPDKVTSHCRNCFGLHICKSRPSIKVNHGGEFFLLLEVSPIAISFASQKRLDFLLSNLA
jgi:hypothetical protein